MWFYHGNHAKIADLKWRPFKISDVMLIPILRHQLVYVASTETFLYKHPRTLTFVSWHAQKKVCKGGYYPPGFIVVTSIFSERILKNARSRIFLSQIHFFLILKLIPKFTINNCFQPFMPILKNFCSINFSHVSIQNLH